MLVIMINELLEELYSMYFHAGIKPGLARVQTLAELHEQPQLRFPSIHVAGTNGKGSVCSMLASILQCAGYKVGLYMSPHVRQFNERIRINGAMISDEDIARLARPLMNEAKPIGGTFFEVTTMMAFEYFAEHRVDVAVIETGLGGRLDATNILTPVVSVINSIDFDHMEYLGTTLESIAREKAGIIKPGVPVVVAKQMDESLRKIFIDKAQEVGASVVFAADEVRVDIDRIDPDFTMSVSAIHKDTLRYYESSLAGTHQALNLTTALATVEQLRSLYFIEEDHIREGLRRVRENTGIEGRIRLLRQDPTVVLDVSHNPAGVEALVHTLELAGYREQSWQVVFGAMRDKDILGMLERLKPLVSTLHLCSPAYDRAQTAGGLEQVARQAGYHDAIVHASVADAVKRAIQRGPTLICGSFYVADEALLVL